MSAPDGRRCNAKAKMTGERCRQYVTPGKRVCKLHGGYSTGQPPIHARYTHALRNAPELLERYEHHKADPQIGELLSEVALLRGLLDTFLAQAGAEIDEGARDQIRDLVLAIERLVAARHKILYGEQVTITTRDYDALVTHILVLVREIYGSDDRYEAFLERLGAELGSARRAPAAGADTPGG